MTKALSHDDIRDFLNRAASVIMRDQICVEKLPSQRFHPAYNDDMWRSWRLDHLAYLNELRNTVHKISSGMLNKLTQLAVTKEPAVVREALIDLLADCASGSYPREDVETAALFFGRLSKLLIAKRDSATTRQDAKASLLLWIARTDPLHISRDPECGYRLAG